MGNPSIEVTEENQEAAQIEKSKAMVAISEGMASFVIINIFNRTFLWLWFLAAFLSVN